MSVMEAISVFSLLLVAVRASVDVKVGMMTVVRDISNPISNLNLLPAAEIAFETVAERLNDGTYKNFNMSYISTDACCTRPVRSTSAIAASFYHDDGVDAFLGPSPDMMPVADMAAYWNLPVVSGVATPPLLDDKTRFPTLTRTGPDLSLVVNFITEIFQHFGWQQCALLRGIPEEYMDIYYQKVLPNAIYTGLEENGITVTEVFADRFETLEEALQKVASLAKVVFISTSAVRDVMVRAHRLGYTKGSHVFLNWFPYNFNAWNAISQFEDLDREELAALEALWVMRMPVPDTAEYHEFHEKLRDRQLTMYGRAEPEEEFAAAATHDAVLMYAQVINETMAEGGDVRDGRAITQKMWNRTFQGVTGPVHINENGDRYGVSELLHMTSLSKGSFSVTATFDEATNTMNIVSYPGGF